MTTLPAAIAADDIVVIYAVAHTPNAPATAFTWPAGFTEGRVCQLNNSGGGGTSVGIAGWAWKRMSGGETGTVSVSQNGDTGTDSQMIANCCKISGCETSGNPFNVEVSNNPFESTTVDWPSITTLVADSLLVTLHIKGGLNSAVSTPTGWTSISSSSATAGSDGAIDADYKTVAAVGTYDPPNGTATIDADTGWATFQIAFIPPQAVPASFAKRMSARGGLRLTP